MSTRQPPAYFQLVRDRARQRWDQLEGDPELAGPWKQLFGQVQSPRHVVSELLQNADDAGAKRVRVSMTNGQFVFEHDGEDFDEEQFASLCRFGFSNKRKLHTIGFRGIGFKSTFSLGETVEVLTPSLAVRFHKRRFTEPVWMDDAPACALTRIAVKIQDPNRERELKKNLQEWVESPASLLFFNRINELTISDLTLRKSRLGSGPVAGSERIRLTGREQHDVMVFASPEEPFPQEAVEEIRQERDVEDLHLPPCRVELVVGLRGEQRLYVVLPTGVIIETPFSCNAPFLQDPARSAIKDPSLSPTNRWLLHRLGGLAAKAMLGWLRDKSLEPDVRAQAYCLLPDKPEEEDSLAADATSAICEGFATAVGNQPILVTTAGQLVDSEKCISPPRRAYAVWAPSQLLEVFGDEDEHVLCEAVAHEHRQRLQSWDWLKGLNDDDLVERLAAGRRIPRPADNSNILALWSLVQQSVRYDYGGQKRRRMAIVPVEGADVLLPANNVVRLSTKKETISDESWAFLVGLVHVIDRQWVQHLAQAKGDEKTIGAAWQLLQDLNLDRPSDANAVVANACRNLFRPKRVSVKDHVQIAHLMAALDAKTPAEFRCVTRDGQQRKLDDGIIATQDPAVEAILPDNWAAAHLLHEAYFSGYSACTRQQWEQWVRSDKSGFWPFAPIRAKKQNIWGRDRLAGVLKSRGATCPTTYPYVTSNFYLSDHDFDDELVEYWAETSETDATIWPTVARRVLGSPSLYWQKRCGASVSQVATTGGERSVPTGVIPAAWIVRLRGLACLPDTQGRVLVPAELYLRTPDTEPLLGVEPFVCAELDTEATKPLLRLLGVRDTPAGLDKLIERVRALARAPDPAPLLSEIVKWYSAMDRALARCDAAGVEEVRKAFASECLILTAAGEWARSSEAFQYAGEDDLPDAPLIHPAANNLGMWNRLGVANRPTADLVLKWLKGLPSAQALEASAVRRVRAALQRYPSQVWQTCRHWLALDNAWVPVERLRFRLTMHSLTKWSELFPAIKGATANLQMLSADVCDRHPFAALPDLGTAVEYRLTRRPYATGGPVQKPWLAALAGALARVKLDDEAETHRVRRTAARLARSAWQPFDDHDSIQVTPYVDGAPAGQSHSPDVLWHEQSIFVRNGKPARSFDALVAELARPFANEAVTEAIKACIERDRGFIAEYMKEHFTLEAETALTPDVSEGKSEVGKEKAKREVEKEGEEGPVTGDGDEEEGREPEHPEEEQDAEDEPRGGPPPRKREPSLFERFAHDRGYHWDGVQHRFVHPDGSWIERSESPFHWRRFDSAGNLVTRYWASQQCLARGGVEIAAELWELFRSSPSECSMILVDGEGRPRELSGPDLLQSVEDKVITLYPAKYRLREEDRT
ncbi:sacsin N-terminal ATP-binding-like domain-containing protein [Fontivita pretiosa]|uniref:sacsin N-terminal ATP-binding-like domain-containing protein n=1 Tax=Fontivita pretiosa TaxID=2989684 RepID=UPI003D162B67